MFKVAKAAPPSPQKKLILYGLSKSVKTPLALAYGAYLRTLNPQSRTLYVAADEGSDGLPSLPDPSWREWIDVLTMSTPLDKDYDPYTDAIKVALTDWKKVDQNYDLVVWDTQSRTLQRILAWIATKNYFTSKKNDDNKHVVIGDEEATKLALPVEGDYGAMVSIGFKLMEAMAAQKTHVIFVAHEEEIRDRKGVKRIGPAAVGQKLVEKLPAFLTGVMYTEKVGKPDPKTGQLVPMLYVYSDTGDDSHIAGVRHEPVNGDPRNPIAQVKVGTDLVKYWKVFFETLYPNEKAAVPQEASK